MDVRNKNRYSQSATLRFARFFFLGIFLFSFAPVFAPLSAEAALIPCGRSGADATAAEKKPCTVCHIVIGGKGIIDYGLKIMTYAAIAVIVAMAIFYIVSTGDEGMMQTAKGGIKAALIGFAVMLAAWLIVNTTLKILSAKVPGLDITSSGFSFSCDTSSSAGSTKSGSAPGTPGSTGSTTGSTPSAPTTGSTPSAPTTGSTPGSTDDDDDDDDDDSEVNPN